MRAAPGCATRLAPTSHTSCAMGSLERTCWPCLARGDAQEELVMRCTRWLMWTMRCRARPAGHQRRPTAGSRASISRRSRLRTRGRSRGRRSASSPPRRSSSTPRRRGAWGEHTHVRPSHCVYQSPCIARPPLDLPPTPTQLDAPPRPEARRPPGRRAAQRRARARRRHTCSRRRSWSHELYVVAADAGEPAARRRSWLAWDGHSPLRC